MEEEPIKYFSLPRPKYNRNPEAIESVEISKVKYRTNAENFRQRRVGGRRFTVDIASTDIEIALGDMVQQKHLSRSISTLNRLSYDDMKLKTLPNMKLGTKQSIMEEDEGERPKGPEFIINSNSEIKTLDISDNKVRVLTGSFGSLLQSFNFSASPRES